MSKKAGQTEAALALETVKRNGYLAWIEWPVLLYMKLRAVEGHLSLASTHKADAVTAMVPVQHSAPSGAGKASSIVARSGAKQTAASGNPVPKLNTVSGDDPAASPAAEDITTNNAVSDFLSNFKMEE